MKKYLLSLYCLVSFVALHNSYCLNSSDVKPLYTFDVDRVKKVFALKNAQEYLVANNSDVWRYDSKSGKRLAPKKGFLKATCGEYFDIHDMYLNPTQSLLYIDCTNRFRLHRRVYDRYLFGVNLKSSKIFSIKKVIQFLVLWIL